MKRVQCSFCSRIIFSSSVRPSVSSVLHQRLSWRVSGWPKKKKPALLHCVALKSLRDFTFSYLYIYISPPPPIRCCFRWCVRCDVLSKAARRAQRRLVLRLQRGAREGEMSWISNGRLGRGWKKKGGIRVAPVTRVMRPFSSDRCVKRRRILFSIWQQSIRLQHRAQLCDFLLQRPLKYGTAATF